MSPAGLTSVAAAPLLDSLPDAGPDAGLEAGLGAGAGVPAQAVSTDAAIAAMVMRAVVVAGMTTFLR
jgi:hypothetical protein